MNTATWLKDLGSGMRASTALLESCGWDEEECEALLERLALFLEGFTAEHARLPTESSTPEATRALYNNLRVGLRSIAREDQIDTIMEFMGVQLELLDGEQMDD